MIAKKYIFGIGFSFLCLLLQAQEITTYQLPIFEVTKAQEIIIGVQNGDRESEVHNLANRKHGVYLSNPFLEQKKIAQIQMEFKKIGSKVKQMQVQFYPANMDSFPGEELLYDTTIHLRGLNKKHISINTRKISMPKNGVVVAFTLLSEKEIKSSLKAGILEGKKMKEKQRIRFDYYEGKWRRYPFEEWNDGSVLGNLTTERTKIVPVINLTLVN